MKRSLYISVTLLILGCSVIALEHATDHTPVAPVADTAPESAETTAADDSAHYNLIQALIRGKQRYGASDSGAIGSFLAGRSASLHGDHTHAAYYLGKTLKKEFSHPHIVSMAIRHHVLSGEVAEAIHLVEDMESDVLSQHRYARLLHIVDALSKDNIDAARQHMEALTPVGMETLYHPFLKSWMHYARDGNVSPVEITQNLNHGQYGSLLHYHEALQYQLIGDEAMASAAYETALSTLRDAPTMLVSAAIRHFAKHNADRAAEIYEAYHALNRREAFWQLRTPERYVAELKDYTGGSIANIADGVAETLSNIGTLLVQEGAHEDGQILLRLALHLRPEDSLTRLILAGSLEDSADPDAAIAIYRTIDTPPFIKELTVLRLARTYYAKDEVATARDMLLALRKTSRATYNLYVMLGDLERGDKAYTKAAEYYSLAINALDEVTEADWPLIYRRGIMYDLSGQWLKAEADFKRALKLRPDEPEVLNYLGYSWLVRDERLEEAKKILKKAVEARPHNAHIIDSYGWALFKLGRYEEALEKIEEALTLIPSDPTVNDHYADILWTLGRRTEARYHWERALQFDPQEPGAAEAIRDKLANGLPEEKEPPTRHSDAR